MIKAILKKILPKAVIRKFATPPPEKKVRKMPQQHTCPLCGITSNELEEIGRDSTVLREKQVIGGGARYAACVKCGSTDRERLIHTYVKHELQIFSREREQRILHIAPEKNLTRVLLAHGFHEYVCGDLFTEGYAYAAHVKNMNVLDIPFEEGHFDLVICNHVLEHVPDDGAAMREIGRVLKPGGRALLQVPISANSPTTDEDPSVSDPRERERRFGQYDHIRIYGQDYPERLTRNGFKVDRVNLAAKYPEHALNPREDLFVCIK